MDHVQRGLGKLTVPARGAAWQFTYTRTGPGQYRSDPGFKIKEVAPATVAAQVERLLEDDAVPAIGQFTMPRAKDALTAAELAELPGTYRFTTLGGDVGMIAYLVNAGQGIDRRGNLPYVHALGFDPAARAELPASTRPIDFVDVEGWQHPTSKAEIEGLRLGPTPTPRARGPLDDVEAALPEDDETRRAVIVGFERVLSGDVATLVVVADDETAMDWLDVLTALVPASESWRLTFSTGEILSKESRRALSRFRIAFVPLESAAETSDLPRGCVLAEPAPPGLWARLVENVIAFGLLDDVVANMIRLDGELPDARRRATSALAFAVLTLDDHLYDPWADALGPTASAIALAEGRVGTAGWSRGDLLRRRLHGVALDTPADVREFLQRAQAEALPTDLVEVAELEHLATVLSPEIAAAPGRPWLPRAWSTDPDHVSRLIGVVADALAWLPRAEPAVALAGAIDIQRAVTLLPEGFEHPDPRLAEVADACAELLVRSVLVHSSSPAPDADWPEPDPGLWRRAMRPRLATELESVVQDPAAPSVAIRPAAVAWLFPVIGASLASPLPPDIVIDEFARAYVAAGTIAGRSLRDPAVFTTSLRAFRAVLSRLAAFDLAAAKAGVATVFPEGELALDQFTNIIGIVSEQFPGVDLTAFADSLRGRLRAGSMGVAPASRGTKRSAITWPDEPDRALAALIAEYRSVRETSAEARRAVGADLAYALLTVPPFAVVQAASPDYAAARPFAFAQLRPEEVAELAPLLTRELVMDRLRTSELPAGDLVVVLMVRSGIVGSRLPHADPLAAWFIDRVDGEPQGDRLVRSFVRDIPEAQKTRAWTALPQVFNGLDQALSAASLTGETGAATRALYLPIRDRLDRLLGFD